MSSIFCHGQIPLRKPSLQLIDPALPQSSLGFLMQLKELLVPPVTEVVAKTQTLIPILIVHC